MQKNLSKNIVDDIISGLIISFLAMPLSLGIAKASEFPPAMGLLTAIIGGIIVTFFTGCKLSIKGPAAGLIVIIIGAVSEFGGGEVGWRLTLGAIVVAGIIQIIFGLMKLGKMAEIFPISAIHGMLAAIGLIIIIKQISVLLNVNPEIVKGKSLFETIFSIFYIIKNLDIKASIIGFISLFIMLFWKKIKIDLIKKIPAPLIVLLITIPLGLMMDFKHTEPPYALLHIGNFFENIKLNVDFSGINQTGIFIKYVIMIALVGSLESLLTVKAVDILDPNKGKSNTDKDLIAVGIGNTISGLLGGLPMISEVARSSTNIANGAKSQWANFFHGFFILLFLLLIPNVIEMIPTSALAAMLISVGINLAHPREFKHAYEMGKDQLAIFLVTIFFTIYEDLLVGIFMGVLLQLVILYVKGLKTKFLFKGKIEIISNSDNTFNIKIEEAGIFLNWLYFKDKIEKLPKNANITLDLNNLKIFDYSFKENILNLKKDFNNLEIVDNSGKLLR
ncbi:MAG: sulfate transporter [Candidatus Sericytochromatia bacterium]|nr:MAG: sulfate transporter [Candidatus Sericytochromatia bacterium]